MLSSKNNDTADEELVRAIKDNDQDAFKILYYRYFQKLISFTYYKLHSVETTRDLVQELFFRIWTGRERLNPQKSIKAYLYKSLNNLIINYKKLRSSQISSLADFDERRIEAEEKQDSRIDFQIAIEKLPEKLKTVYILSRIEGYKNAEIAEICNISVKAVEKRITKMFVLLKKALD
jgi:RNA polymerase sigma factor (sigma-70 family)